jgi:hypothetical protein
MDWQRATVRPALRSLCLMLGRSGLFLLFLAGGLNLFGLFEPQ